MISLALNICVSPYLRLRGTPPALIRKLISTSNNDAASHNRFNSIVANKIKISAHLTGKGGLRRFLIVVWCVKLCTIYILRAVSTIYVGHSSSVLEINKTFELGRFNINASIWVYPCSCIYTRYSSRQVPLKLTHKTNNLCQDLRLILFRSHATRPHDSFRMLHFDVLWHYVVRPLFIPSRRSTSRLFYYIAC